MATKTVYQDERYLTQASKLDAEKAAAINDSNKGYDDAIASNNEHTQKQIDAVNQYKDEQIQLQNEQTGLAIEKLEKQQEWAHQDYIKEQSGAYVDWQKQSNPYGVEAEKRASAGLAGSGYSESSLVSMYNTYQNRMAVAREAFTRANTNFAMSIAEAQKQNSVELAKIAATALQQELQLAAAGAQYNNTLLLQKAADKRDIEKSYYSRYQDVVDQIYREDALAEDKRQADLAHERQLKEIEIAKAAQRLDEQKFAYEKKKDAEAKAAAKAASSKKPSGGSSKSRSKAQTQKLTTQEKKIQKADSKSKSTVSASQYLNKLIASGASKDKVSNEIAIALREGAITKAEAQKLRNTFTPRGLAY